jgi:hypothetical protein
VRAYAGVLQALIVIADRGHIQFRRAILVRSFTSTLLYAAAVIAAPFSPLAALAMLVFVPSMFNIPMLLRDSQS